MIIPEVSGQDTIGFRLSAAVEFDRAIDGSPFAPHLAVEERRAKLFDELTPERFIASLATINYVLLRGSEWGGKFATHIHSIIEEGSDDSLDIPPAPEDKADSLAMVLESAKTLQDPNEQALVIGYGINAVHPFAHANGRTSRAAYWLLTKDYQYGDPGLIDLLSIDGDDTANLNPGLFVSAVSGNMQLNLGSHVQDPSTYEIEPVVRVGFIESLIPPPENLEQITKIEELRLALQTVFLDKNLGPMIVHVLREYTDVQSVNKALIRDVYGNKGFAIDLFLKHASDEDLQEAYMTYRVVKRQFIEQFLKHLCLGDESSLGIMSPTGSYEGAVTAMELAKLNNQNLV